MADLVVRMNSFDAAPEPAGLKDGGHTILSCSACGKALVDIWVVKADAVNPHTGRVFEWKMVALCCYCGDRSFQATVRGRYALGCVGRDIPNPDPEGMDDSKLETSVTRVEPRDGVLVFHTRKRE